MEDSDDIICIYKTHDSTEADLIKARPEGEGIPCFLKSDNAGGVLSHLTMITSIWIMIRQRDEIEAEQIMDDWLENNNEH